MPPTPLMAVIIKFRENTKKRGSSTIARPTFQGSGIA